MGNASAPPFSLPGSNPKTKPVADKGDRSYLPPPSRVYIACH